jgi:uncharacterized protein
LRSRLARILAAAAISGAIACSGTPSAAAAERDDVVAEDVHFRHGDDLLAGTLFRPPAPGTYPAVVFILGSDDHDRTYGGTFTAIGKHFARHGFVCLSWDKPGVGASTGDYKAQTFQDRAEEALAAIRFLQSRPEVLRNRVGIWGHSQGGTVAPLAASLSSDVAFVIEVAGWQGPAWQQDVARVEAELRASGFSEQDVQRAVDFAKVRMDLIRGEGPFEALDRAQEAVAALPWFAHVHRCDRALFESARRMVNFDNAPTWEKVRCPVLVIFGDKDVSSGPPAKLVTIIRDGLRKAGNADVTIRLFPDADHSICRVKAPRGNEPEPSAKNAVKPSGPDFVPGYLDTMTTWLIEKCRAANARP